MRRGDHIPTGLPVGRRAGGDRAVGAYLEALHSRFHRLEHLPQDPLAFLHRYDRPADIEVVGLVAALLAFGRVEQIRRSVERVLATLGPRPAEAVRRLEPAAVRRALRGFTHRWCRGEDVAALLAGVRRALETRGSLEALFLEGYASGRPDAVRAALSRFAGTLRAGAPRGAARRRGFLFLLPAPDEGSACKRLNLYLRWMARRDDPLDRGVWRSVSPADLIVPLDTHVARIARATGLSRRRTPDWAMAEEVTAGLRRHDPADPTRFDFAICRAGMVAARVRPAARPSRRRRARPTARRAPAGGSSR
jgi:uncharacterized protein (TIGR02757 family)